MGKEKEQRANQVWGGVGGREFSASGDGDRGATQPYSQGNPKGSGMVWDRTAHLGDPGAALASPLVSGWVFLLWSVLVIHWTL